jgi:hypothetical protein
MDDDEDADETFIPDLRALLRPSQHVELKLLALLYRTSTPVSYLPDSPSRCIPCCYNEIVTGVQSHAEPSTCPP